AGPVRPGQRALFDFSQIIARRQAEPAFLAYLPTCNDPPAAFHSAPAAVPDFVVQVDRRARVARHTQTCSPTRAGPSISESAPLGADYFWIGGGYQRFSSWNQVLLGEDQSIL